MLMWRFRLLMLLACLAVPAPANAQEIEITDKARAHFSAGVNFMQDPDGARYEEAYREFKTAYAESPSWKILGNLGICAMKLERDGEAIEAFEKYLSEGGAAVDGGERTQFERDLQTLRTGVVMVTLTSVPSGAVITDQRIPVQGNPVTNRYELGSEPVTIGIRSGHHKMVASLGGHEDAIWEFDAVSGASTNHTFELSLPSGSATSAGPRGLDAPSGGTTRPLTTGVYVGMAVTGALLVGGSVVGVMALGRAGEYDDANDGNNVSEAESLKDEVTTLNLVADGLFGAAVVGAAITTYLFATRPEVPTRPQAAGMRLDPIAGPGAGGVILSGAF